MAREYAFVQVDVFTDRVFGGNPLAVLLDARGLEAEVMQAIAREMNLSETVFLLPATDPGCAVRARIFTPAGEIPFAGHPTLGAAWVAAAHGLVPPGTRTFALEEGIGPVPVELGADGLVWMRQRDAEFGEPLADRAGVAATLGLDGEDLRPAAPVQVVSTGREVLLVPLRDRGAVDRARLDTAAFIAGAGPTASLGVLVFAVDADARAPRTYARMFAPRSGVAEDPATGSAAGPLGAYLVRHGLAGGGDGEVLVLGEQGTRMGRRSFLHVRLRARGRDATDLRVGGGVVPVIEGRLRVA